MGNAYFRDSMGWIHHTINHHLLIQNTNSGFPFTLPLLRLDLMVIISITRFYRNYIVQNHSFQAIPSFRAQRQIFHQVAFSQTKNYYSQNRIIYMENGKNGMLCILSMLDMSPYFSLNGNVQWCPIEMTVSHRNERHQLAPILPLLPLFFSGKKEARQAILVSMKRSHFYRTLR